MASVPFVGEGLQGMALGRAFLGVLLGNASQQERTCIHQAGSPCQQVATALGLECKPSQEECQPSKTYLAPWDQGLLDL